MSAARIPISDPGRIFAAYGDLISTTMLDTARSGCWINGAQVRAFAQAFAAYTGVPHCLPVANGTDALELAMQAVMLTHRPGGREVLTVANAGGYTVSACRHLNLTPVFVDIDEATQNLDLSAAVAAVGPETAMLVVTHLYGNPVDVPSLKLAIEEVRPGHLPIIEDCAQAHGARIRGHHVGSMGDIATFSFYPTKNLGAMGDAGAITTSNPTLYDNLVKLHQYGWSEKYRVTLAGGRNSRMDELQAAVLVSILPFLDQMNVRRRELLSAYRIAADCSLQFVNCEITTVAHLAVALSSRREEFRQHMSARNIATDIHYPVLDCDQPGWADLPQRIGPIGLSSSRRSVQQIVTVPCFPFMTDDEANRVLEALHDWSVR